MVFLTGFMELCQGGECTRDPDGYIVLVFNLEKWTPPLKMGEEEKTLQLKVCVYECIM